MSTRSVVLVCRAVRRVRRAAAQDALDPAQVGARDGLGVSIWLIFGLGLGSGSGLVLRLRLGLGIGIELGFG